MKSTASSQSVVSKAAALSISLLLTSATAVSGTLPYINSELGIDKSQSEILMTVPAFAVVVFIFVSTWVERKIGMKRAIALALLVVGIGGIIPMFTNVYAVLFASRLLFGAGLGLYNSLAVSLINVLYTGDTRATLMGFRSAAESLGSAVLTVVAGLLLALGWHWSYAIYLLAFPLIVFFWFAVPDVKTSAVEEGEKEAESAEWTAKIPAEALGRDGKEHMPPVVYALTAFAIVMLINSTAISVRFPTIASSIMGEDYNTSFLLAITPILGMIASVVFGVLNKYMGQNLLYLGIAVWIVSDACLGLCGNSLVLASAGLLLSGIPGAWCFPYIYNMIGNITGPRTGTMATSLVLVGCNLGNFISPLAMSAIDGVFGSDSLTLPFTVLGVIFVIILAVMVFANTRAGRRNAKA